MVGYREIARELDRRIRAGVYGDGEALPARLELLGEFGVARATLDRAVRVLVDAGKLSSRRGAGTYVLPGARRRCVVGWIGNPRAESRLACGLSHRVVLPGDLERSSSRAGLEGFDGLLWDCPQDFLLPVIESFRGRLPQVVVNRTLAGVDCVSTDHRGAYRAIAEERLTAHPGAVPVFLQTDREQLPTRYRLEGFADACRARQVFYECWRLPDGFAERLRLLRERFAELDPGRTWLVFSDSLRHTGTVMRIAAEDGWRWRRDRFYSDFDDAYGRDVWGWRVTSFVQDMAGLRREAGRLLERRIAGGEASGGSLKLLFPERVEGDT